MTTLAWTYAAYLALSVVITVWVGRTLHAHGRLFLIDCFGGNVQTADSANHLLIVGFYLVNIAFVMLTLKAGIGAVGALEGVELLGRKVGVVLLTLGAMHFFNLLVLSALRRLRTRRPARRHPAC